MQRYDKLKEMPTITILNCLSVADKQQDQQLINLYAYELACRLYIPNKEVNFDKIVASFGYKENQEEEEKDTSLIKRR